MSARHRPVRSNVETVGKPITPEYGSEAGDNPELVQEFADRVEHSIRSLLGIALINDMGPKLASIDRP